ncbi:MAG TPA: family 1 glycosylhydrolase [Gemmatimonadaceae bacterium]|nr:family 1 glycosylhydrolase [Gemmatimonadaceae bacterium]
MPQGAPEIWGGIECTVNRVGDRYFDQLERSGHAHRANDLDRIAALGIRTLRYPVLWERVAPAGLDGADWEWPRERLARLQQLGIAPIVGLLHHGSGPRETSLIDPHFPKKFAAYARAVAERFPDVEMYTPINEPLTTARFSGLYGHWHPHARNGRVFARALLNQLRGIVLAMREIRDVNSAARLVQTEDLGKAHSTAGLAYQAAFENERRWLTFDLLCGRELDAAQIRYFRRHGISRGELYWFEDNPMPPDVIGINHYVTSERFLDERVSRYPSHARGGNGREAYADVEAVRVLGAGPLGPAALLREAWDRYGLPLAVTEVHLSSAREEQLRWLSEFWDAARTLRNEGVEVRAVTPWALFGSFDWHNLVTHDEGHYEPGAFDIRGPEPRSTALAAMIANLAAGRAPDDAVLAQPGWWRRKERLVYPGFHVPSARATRATPGPHPAPILITGASGTLGRAFARICQTRAIDARITTRRDLDIASPADVQRAMERHRPWAVVNAAGYVRVDDAEWAVERCHRENALGAEVLAERCTANGVGLVVFSSDLVFDGQRSSPYVEGDPVTPLNEYGRSKADAERRVLGVMRDALVVRTSAFFGPWDSYNVVTQALRALARGESYVAASDVVVSPTYVPDLVHATLDLLVDRASGVWHLANTGAVTWADLIRHAADLADVNASRLDARASSELGYIASRPSYSALASERATLLPPLGDALERYTRDCAPETSLSTAWTHSPS